MRTERLIAAVLFAIAILGTLAVQSGLIDLRAFFGGVIGEGAGVAAPRLDDSAMIRRGAAHYDLVCAKCHASPNRPDQGDHLDLTPPAPKLHLRVGVWPPEALFTTIRDGIANSAMPAWPSPHRDDEVWAMVAFLGVLPDLDRATYRSLAGLDVDTSGVPPVMATCVRCHRADGRGTPDGAFPRLDIQSAEYLRDALQAFRDGRRASGFMQSAVGALHDDELDALALAFAANTPVILAPAVPPLITDGSPERRIPPCAACHGPPDSARPAFPRLSGQHEGYLARQLRLFAAEEFTRGGGPFAHLMREAGHALTDADIAAVTKWYGTEQ